MPTPKRRNDDVARLKPFRDANKYAINSDNGRLYVVYSYGPHFPMFVFDRAFGQWYANEDRYSATTSKHIGQCYPHMVRADEFCYASTKHLIAMIDNLTQDQLEDVPC